jgi:hypothetical protein
MNYFTENKDILFNLKNMDLSSIVKLKEKNFEDYHKHNIDYAPEDYKEAMDNYHRILEVMGDICGNYISIRAESVDEEGAHYENGDVTYAKGTRENMKRLKQAGLMGFTIPRRYGGLNCPTSIYTIAVEMISRADASLMNIFGLQEIGETIYFFGDEDQKEHYLPLFCKGEVTGSMALTEPEAGSDLQSVKLKASYDDQEGHWKLNGMKRFITNGLADVALVLARSEEGTHDARGLSMFLYRRDENMKIRRIENKLGIHGSPTCELQFNNAKCELVGQRKRGLIKYVMSLMNGARLGVSAQAVGIASAAYYEAYKYANERKQFGKYIIDFPAVYSMLTDMKIKEEASRRLLYLTSYYVDYYHNYDIHLNHYNNKSPEIKEGYKKYTRLSEMFTPLCKLYTTEMANQVAYDAIQIHGGPGFMKDFPVERFYRDARITNIYEGTSQLQVVAAIGPIMKGIAYNWMNEMMETLRYIDNIDIKLLNKVERLTNIFEKSVIYMKDVEDKDHFDYNARRVCDMANMVIIAMLFLEDSTKDDRKHAVCKYWIDNITPKISSDYELLTMDMEDYFSRKDSIIRDF